MLELVAVRAEALTLFACTNEVRRPVVEMSADSKRNHTVVRTSRGLTIAGTRKTLYQVMECLSLGWPAKLIRDWLDLTDEQIADVMRYIDEHRPEVEAEYQQVLRQAEERRQYWEERNRERFAQIATQPPGTDYPAARVKLAQAQSKRRRS